MKIPEETRIEMLKGMLRIRLFEEKIQELYLAGYIPGSMHLSTGQEAVSVGVCMSLQKDDYVLSSHRGHGHMLARGAKYKYMMAELYGKRSGYCKGKGGSMHFAHVKIGVLGANGIVGGGIPIAAGVGFSSKYLKNNRVTACFFGDGATETGAFHEGLNFAAVLKVPVVFIIENNQYAISVPRRLSDRLEDLSIRAKSYGMPGESVDGNDVIAVYHTAQRAVHRARSGDGPTLIECKTYRWHGHHAGEPKDGLIYRSQEEIDAWKRKCPIKQLKGTLLEEKVITEGNIEKIEREFEQELEKAIAYANESPFPVESDLLQDVYIEEG
ncbi:MAG: acetoin:2,6-dichlorophenolindophenol oxidoreductase subunit alpha [Spirochaetes bacterium DG_61]|nr:MAG: acetoin:2,6-dichlorophenolindophenol oxidoreductase subunit alpha [Spirochaetes bacterium DG_61]